MNKNKITKKRYSKWEPRKEISHKNMSLHTSGLFMMTMISIGNTSSEIFILEVIQLVIA